MSCTRRFSSSQSKPILQKTRYNPGASILPARWVRHRLLPVGNIRFQVTEFAANSPICPCSFILVSSLSNTRNSLQHLFPSVHSNCSPWRSHCCWEWAERPDTSPATFAGFPLITRLCHCFPAIHSVPSLPPRWKDDLETPTPGPTIQISFQKTMWGRLALRFLSQPRVTLKLNYIPSRITYTFKCKWTARSNILSMFINATKIWNMFIYYINGNKDHF